MPASKPLNIYIPIAFVAVVAVAAFIAANPSALFRLLNPLETMEKVQQQKLYAIGSEDRPLKLEEARDLFEQYSSGTYAASVALVNQDKSNGLPEKFIEEVKNLLIESDASNRPASSLISRLADHRPFDERVEGAYAQAVAPAKGGVYIPPIEALASIGKYRLLTESTLEILLGVAESRSHEAHSALVALQSTARGHGLPDWTLQRLELIGKQRPGTIGSEAIKTIAEAGERERALALLNVKEKPFVDPAAVALALPRGDLSQLVEILKDDSYTDKVRVGAFEQLVKRRDQSELVGDAFTYAFSSERAALRLVAFAEYSGWGRHHSRSIFISWPELLRGAFDDDDQTMRYRVTSAFRFTPFDTRQQRDEFLLEMLHGTENQQLTALGCLSSLPLVPDSITARVSDMTKSATPSVAEQAAVLHERYRPKGRLEGFGSIIAGTLFWVLLVLPALTAVGFATYFVACLLQSMAAGWQVIMPLLITLVWLVLSIALGLVLAMGVMGLHGGTDEELYAVLLVLNMVFASAGWLLSLIFRKFSQNQADG